MTIRAFHLAAVGLLIGERNIVMAGQGVFCFIGRMATETKAFLFFGEVRKSGRDFRRRKQIPLPAPVTVVMAVGAGLARGLVHACRPGLGDIQDLSIVIERSVIPGGAIRIVAADAERFQR